MPDIRIAKNPYWLSDSEISVGPTLRPTPQISLLHHIPINNYDSRYYIDIPTIHLLR